jgi:hypothetical protein
MKHVFLVAVAAVGLALFAATGLVYPQQTRNKDKDKVMDRLEVLTVWKMMEALDLDKGTANKIMEVRSKFLGDRKALQKGLNEDFQRLRQLLQEPPKAADDSELARLVQDVRDKRKKLSQLHDAQYEAVSKLLSVRQQAELILFLKDFRKEIHAILNAPPGPPQEPGKGGRFRPPTGPPPPAAPPFPGSPTN